MLDKDKKIGYIRVAGFNQHTAEELKKALEQLKEEGVKGLILDLRDDPGGLLSAAVEVSDMFLDKGEIVSTKGRNTQPKTYEAQKDGPFEDLPMVVLINQKLGVGLRDRRGGASGPQPGRDRRPAVLRQGLGPEHHRSGRRQQRAQADGGQLLSSLGREHPPIQERKGHRQVGRLARQGTGGQAITPATSSAGSRPGVERDRDAAAKGHRKPAAPALASAETGKKAGSDEKLQAKADQKPEVKTDAEKPQAKSKSARSASGAVRR